MDPLLLSFTHPLGKPLPSLPFSLSLLSFSLSLLSGQWGACAAGGVWAEARCLCDGKLPPLCLGTERQGTAWPRVCLCVCICLCVILSVYLYVYLFVRSNIKLKILFNILSLSLSLSLSLFLQRWSIICIGATIDPNQRFHCRRLCRLWPVTDRFFPTPPFLVFLKYSQGFFNFLNLSFTISIFTSLLPTHIFFTSSYMHISLISLFSFLSISLLEGDQL